MYTTETNIYLFISNFTYTLFNFPFISWNGMLKEEEEDFLKYE